MPGTNAGTGQPLTFQCSNCRRIKGAVRPPGYIPRGYIGRVRLTGRKRFANPKGNASRRSSTHAREYECLDCGHVGWSRHTDLKYLEKKA